MVRQKTKNSDDPKFDCIIKNRKLYSELRAAITLGYNENKTKQYFEKRVINDKNIWDDKTFNSKYESLKNECEQSQRMWLFGENSFCFSAYILVVITAILEIFNSLVNIEEVCYNFSMALITFLLVIFSFLIDRLKKDSEKKGGLEVLFIVCNKYLPTPTFLVTFLIYMLKIYVDKYFLIFIIIFFIVLIISVIIWKYIMYLRVNKDVLNIK